MAGTIRMEWNEKPVIDEVEKFIDDNCEIIAKSISRDAKASTAFKNKSGKLRRSIRAKKSKFEDGGWIVQAGGKGARQAWLVEHGHGGPHPAPPHPYLRPALEINIAGAKSLFGAK